MTTFALAVASMLALTALAWIAGRISRLPLCPVCAGVSGTWLWLLAARQAGFVVDPVVLAILLGASVVGAAQWMETRLPPGRSPLLWKTLALPCGCAVAYGIVVQYWTLAAVGAVALAGLVALFLRPRRATVSDPAVVAQLQERMKRCC